MQTRRTRILYVGDAVSGNENFLAGLWSCAPESWVIRGYDPTIAGLDAIRGWEPDGLILGLNRRSGELDTLLANWPNLPIIYIGDNAPEPSVSLRLDEAHLGRLAADYFIERGFYNFAYPTRLHGESDARLSGLLERLDAAGFDLIEWEANESPSPWRNPGTTISNDRAFTAWLQNLPKPVAIIANSLWAGVGLLEYCLEAKLRVPEQVAVLAIGSHSSLALSSSPELSCLEIDLAELGRQAIALLARKLEGTLSPPHTEVFTTGRIITRASSAVLTSADPLVNKCLSYIQSHIDQALSVELLTQHAGVSRRVLERRFKENLSRSPFEEIQRQRFECACRLLAEPSIPIAEVGARCGFADPYHFSAFFKRRAGCAPSVYRIQSSKVW